ncbi:MAG: GPI anchored serine-threonine rich family protein [Candidatus Hydrogenedentes bacterium]|nr:GPI anchored serine-threonine rich family protein [Candidatus Hydrogenedentota bacterium]
MFGSTMRIAVFILAMVLCIPAYALHHLMQIETVIGSVNGDTAAQAIQLRMRSGTQNFLSGSKLKCYDAAGANPVVLFDFNSSVSNGSTGNTVLLTTAAFDALTTPECNSDFTLTNRIPDSYFAAGRVTFEEDDGSVLWALAWGGGAYTGPTTGNDDNDADGNFGAAFGVGLANSVKYPQAAAPFHLTLAAIALSTTNVADYEVTENGTVTNNDGNSFAVDGGPKSINITAPDSGDHLDTGTTFNIRWNFSGNISRKVRIELFDGPDKITTIAKKAKYNRKFTWDVPGDLPDGTNYRIRVMDKANDASDKSDAFTIETH